MALPLPAGLTPPEIAFLCEMELVTVVPRQRFEGLDLLGGKISPLQPPYRSSVPLWLALLLKRQRRADIFPPPWLSAPSLSEILEFEKSTPSFSPSPALPPQSTASPPFLPSATADAPPDALPYHWLELGEMILDAATDDVEDPDTVRRLMRDLREVRMAKMREAVKRLDGGKVVGMDGVGGMEVAEGRALIGGVVDGLRKIGASKESARREREAEEREDGIGEADYDDDDDDMQL
ncbi:MAG: DNA replication protein psf2 [Icmadophila ericetorum]|nr:DNA replication protein psf2 [Icmadophila ericetorum]